MPARLQPSPHAFESVSHSSASLTPQRSHPSALKRLRVYQRVATVPDVCTSLRLAIDKPRRLHQSFRLAHGLRLRRSAWRAARTAHGLPGGLPSSPQPLACGCGWGELPVGTQARCGEAPVGSREKWLYFSYTRPRRGCKAGQRACRPTSYRGGILSLAARTRSPDGVDIGCI